MRVQAAYTGRARVPRTCCTVTAAVARICSMIGRQADDLLDWHGRLGRDSGELWAKAVLERRRVDFVEDDLAGHDLLLPGLVRRLQFVEFRHDLVGEQFEALANVLVRIVAGLVEQDDLVDVAGRELAQLLANGVG